MPAPHSGNQDVFCVSKLKMLADPTRLSVLKTLMGGSRSVGDLMMMLGVEQSLLSHHLGVLRDAGMVTATRAGKSMLYRLTSGVEGSAASGTINLGCCQLAFDDPHQEIPEKQAVRIA